MEDHRINRRYAVFWQLFSNGSIRVSCLYIPLQWVILHTLDTRTYSYTHTLLRATLSFIIHTYCSFNQSRSKTKDLSREKLVCICSWWSVLAQVKTLACYSWWLAAPRRSWWLKVFLPELANDCGSPKKFVRGLSSTTPGWWTETLSERPRLGDLGGDKTLSECHNVDWGCVPTHRHHGKKSGCLLRTPYFQALTFMQLFMCLTLEIIT